MLLTVILKQTYIDKSDYPSQEYSAGINIEVFNAHHRIWKHCVLQKALTTPDLPQGIIQISRKVHFVRTLPSPCDINKRAGYI